MQAGQMPARTGDARLEGIVHWNGKD